MCIASLMLVFNRVEERTSFTVPSATKPALKTSWASIIVETTIACVRPPELLSCSRTPSAVWELRIQTSLVLN